MSTLDQTEINIGIDTSATQLDVYVRPIGDVFSFPNTPAGVKDLVKRRRTYKPERVLIEATSRLEMTFVIAANKASLPVVVCNPGQVRQFAKAAGRVAKTGALNAQDIAHFGEALKPEAPSIK